MLCCAVGYIYYIYFLRSSSIFKYLRSSSIVKKLRSSYKIIIRLSFIFHLVGLKQCCIPKTSTLDRLEQNWGHLPFGKNWGHLPFSKILRLSSSSCVKIRLHTENQHPGLPGSVLKVCVVGGGVESEFSDQLWLWPSRTIVKLVQWWDLVILVTFFAI